MNAEPFGHPVEHLLLELTWIRTSVRAYLERTGRKPFEEASRKDMLSGFAVTDDEARALLEHPEQIPMPPGEAGLLRQHIDARVAASREAGLELPLDHVARTFDLDPLSRLLLVLLVGGEIDEPLRRLYMYAWNDFTRRQPTVEFLLSLLQPSTVGRALNAQGFFSGAPLLRWHLVRLGDGAGAEAPYLARTVRLAPTVAAWCFGGVELDPALAGVAEVQSEKGEGRRLVLGREVREPVDRALAQVGVAGAPVVVLVGSAGTGKSALAREHLTGAGRRVVHVRAAALVRPLADAERRIAALERDARLLEAPLVLDLADADQEDPALGPAWHALADLASAHPFGAVVTARDGASWFVSLLDQAVVLHLPLPSKEDRRTLWAEALEDGGADDPSELVLEAGSRYPLSGGSIRRAATAAVASAESRAGGAGTEVLVEDVVQACRAQLTPRLSGIAQRIVTTFTWDDLVLTEEGRARLREIVSYARHERKVFGDWGYGRIVPYGRGLSVLFSGPPGTGKTMAAGIIAGELGMELFRIDLSRTVSKYIGETEKNLGRIFDEAGKSQSVLLFDEADSLFARRTDVKTSVDRYANLEVNYLLQRMEDFEGVTILTTNFEGSLDEAFRRRIRFRVQFPAPDAKTRAVLWAGMIPALAPRDEALDFELLGEEYELTGGHIKNAVLRAAFLAAEAGRGLTNKDFHQAARQECLNLGKVVRTYEEGP